MFSDLGRNFNHLVGFKLLHLKESVLDSQISRTYLTNVKLRASDETLCKFFKLVRVVRKNLCVE